MARPERHDADYFPFIAKRGRTLNILQAKYGLEGIGFFTNLLRLLTLTPDHHYCIKTHLDQMNLFAEIGITDETKGLEILALLATTGKIDADLWHKNRVIVSADFIEGLKSAYEKRRNKIMTIDEIRVKYTGNPIASELPAPETQQAPVVSSTDNPQRIGKDTKGKDTKVYDAPEAATLPKETRFRKPTVEEVEAYCLERRNSIKPEQFFNYYDSKGWRIGNAGMKDWKAAVRTWEANEKKYGKKPAEAGYKFDPKDYKDI